MDSSHTLGNPTPVVLDRKHPPPESALVSVCVCVSVFVHLIYVYNMCIYIYIYIYVCVCILCIYVDVNHKFAHPWKRLDVVQRVLGLQGVLPLEEGHEAAACGGREEDGVE